MLTLSGRIPEDGRRSRSANRPCVKYAGGQNRSMKAARTVRGLPTLKVRVKEAPRVSQRAPLDEHSLGARLREGPVIVAVVEVMAAGRAAERAAEMARRTLKKDRHQG